MAAHQRIRRRQQLLQVLGNLRVPRLIMDRENPLEYLTGEETFRRYRFLPETIFYLLGLLPAVNRPNQRGLPLPPILALLVALRFFATGSIHLLVGESLRISRSTAGRCIREIASHLGQLAGRFVSFPTAADADRTKHGFYRVAGFPNVLGAVDGTHIKLLRPRENERDFVNRKGFHSLNVQMCCDHRFRITSLSANWPGSVHDSRVFRQSGICEQFENGTHRGILLGDSGYPCRNFLMVPFLNPNAPAEMRYNRALCRTRVLIEQSFGILKRRFQLMQGTVRSEPQQAVIYVVACVVLHNIGISRGDIIDVEQVEEDQEMPQEIDEVGDGMTARRHLVNTFFN